MQNAPYTTYRMGDFAVEGCFPSGRRHMKRRSSPDWRLRSCWGRGDCDGQGRPTAGCPLTGQTRPTPCAVSGRPCHCPRAEPGGNYAAKGGARSENTILHILRNAKYAGDLLQKKYVTVDYLTHRKVENRGQEEQICLRNHHQAIVDRETWEGVQRELTRRSAARQGGERHSARYWPSGRGVRRLRSALCPMYQPTEGRYDI